MKEQEIVQNRSERNRVDRENMIREHENSIVEDDFHGFLHRNCEDTEQLHEQEMSIRFASYPENEQFARMVVTAFLMDLNPTIDEMADIKTAVSEAVTNAIIHGYEGCVGQVCLTCRKRGGDITVTVCDQGKGIADVEKAREPFFTTRPEAERSGMGFSFMEAFMDEVHITSAEGRGTSVEMKKQLHLSAEE